MAIVSRKAFVDSTIFIAFIDRASPNHQKAVKIMENLAIRGLNLYTSSQVIIGTYAHFCRDISNAVALEFFQAILQTGIEILFPQKADLITANRILRANREKQIAINEALNAILMQKRGINQILTFSYWHKLFGTDVSSLAE